MSPQVREPAAEEREAAREGARAAFDGILRSLRQRVFEAGEEEEEEAAAPQAFRRNKNGVVRRVEAEAAPAFAVPPAGDAGRGDGGDGEHGPAPEAARS